ncbi:MAG: MBL fold metallo-hydrolase [Actinobacteria bacterium]|nr:MBL fold metallo-hydrolase [Actinomycetota bacterium]
MKIAEDIYLIGSAQFGLSSPLDCHVYLVKDGEDIIIIDTGAGKKDSDVDYILKNIKNDGLNVSSINRVLLTHAHADHAGGGSSLKAKIGCEIIANKITKSMVEKGDEHELGLDFAKRSGFYGDDYTFKTYKVDRLINDGEIIKVGNSEIMAIHTPGHSTDSMCYLLKRVGTNVLFTGDVVNLNGKFILLNCYGFDLKEYRENIKKLSNLSIDMLLPGHGVFTLVDGQSHIDILVDAFDKLLINNQLIL